MAALSHGPIEAKVMSFVCTSSLPEIWTKLCSGEAGEIVFGRSV